MSGAGPTGATGQQVEGTARRRAGGMVLQSVRPLGAAILGRASGAKLSRMRYQKAKGQPVEVVVSGPEGRVISGAEVTYIGADMTQTDVAVTDRNGRAVLSVPDGPAPDGVQLLVEAKGHWGRRIPQPFLHPVTHGPVLSNTVCLSALEGPAIDSLSWGLEAMGLSAVSSLSFLGQRFGKSALILTEFGCHPMGQPIVFCDSEGPLIETRRGFSEPTMAMVRLLWDAAPEAEVTVIPLSLVPTVAEAIAALDWCISHGIDVACLCVASGAWDDRLHAALKRARRAGVLVICPTGDGFGSIPFPAACEDVLGVAALGHRAACPKGSAHAALNGLEGRDGFCLSSLAARGDGVDLVAPGIAVVADDRIQSGSALAAVHVMGFALCLLHSEETMHRTPRSGVRLLDLTSSILAHCMDLGFAPDQQGAGMPVWGMKGLLRKSATEEARLAKGAQSAMDLIAQSLS